MDGWQLLKRAGGGGWAAAPGGRIVGDAQSRASGLGFRRKQLKNEALEFANLLRNLGRQETRRRRRSGRRHSSGRRRSGLQAAAPLRDRERARGGAVKQGLGILLL
jgi:hypothetical protein